MRPFELVVREHGGTVLRVCRAVVGPVDAEDAWSETFLAALRAYPSLAPGANLEAWLVTIAHRKAIDLLRARARRPVPTERLPDTAVPPPETPDEVLMDALASLTPRQRDAVAYHYVAGLPYAQVADVVGGSVDAARRAASDGVAALRRLLAAPPPEAGVPRGTRVPPRRTTAPEPTSPGGHR